MMLLLLAVSILKVVHSVNFTLSYTNIYEEKKYIYRNNMVIELFAKIFRKKIIFVRTIICQGSKWPVVCLDVVILNYLTSR